MLWGWDLIPFEGPMTTMVSPLRTALTMPVCTLIGGVKILKCNLVTVMVAGFELRTMMRRRSVTRGQSREQEIMRRFAIRRRPPPSAAAHSWPTVWMPRHATLDRVY
jgi:hypothetical protein